MELPGQETVLPEAAPWRIAGEVLNTYIICEDDAETLWLIDKHAAHERMNFDRLMTSKEPPMRQTLLQPIAVEPGKEDAALLLDNLELLEQFGFGCEDFGDGAILVRRFLQIWTRRHRRHAGGICTESPHRPESGRKAGGAAAHHGLQGRHQGRLDQRPRRVEDLGGKGAERGGPVLPPRTARGGEGHGKNTSLKKLFKRA